MYFTRYTPLYVSSTFQVTLPFKTIASEILRADMQRAYDNLYVVLYRAHNLVRVFLVSAMRIYGAILFRFYARRVLPRDSFFFCFPIGRPGWFFLDGSRWTYAIKTAFMLAMYLINWNSSPHALRIITWSIINHTMCVSSSSKNRFSNLLRRVF